MHANWIFLLARTDPAAEKAKGLSFLLVPVDQPGVEVRFITNMAGQSELASFTFTGARTSASNLVGGENNGARVALTLLGFERGAGGVAAAAEYAIELNRPDLVRFPRDGPYPRRGHARRGQGRSGSGPEGRERRRVCVHRRLESEKASIVATDGTVTDGPYPETKEVIGGLIEVPSREDALKWAAKIAVACRCAQEVRVFQPGPDTAAMLRQADNRR